MCDKNPNENIRICIKCEDRCEDYDDILQAANEDAWDRKHQYLDPHPRDEYD